MADTEQIELIQKCAASIWENAEKIAGNYKYQTGLDINIQIRYGTVPSISVNQTLVPELAVELYYTPFSPHDGTIDSAPKIHLAIAAKKIEKTRVIAEPANKGLRESAVASSFSVKLSQFLPLVKDKALADYIPPQFESEGKVEDVQGLELGHGRTDSEGNALTEQQQRYFQDSKVRNVSGNLQIVYHGTDADFTVFKDSDSGNYFSYTIRHFRPTMEHSHSNKNAPHLCEAQWPDSGHLLTLPCFSADSGAKVARSIN